MKLYFDSVMINFIVFIALGLLFKEQYLENSERINDELEYDKERKNVSDTWKTYLLISCIPIIRTICLIIKAMIIFCPDTVILILKDIERDK